MTSLDRQTIATIQGRMFPVQNIWHYSPITANKGKVGQDLETVLGIPHSSDCLDCIDGELKIVPFKKNKNGKIVPKETIAVTMLNPADLTANDFETSRCFKKLTRVLIVPYVRENDYIIFLEPVLMEHCVEKYGTIYHTLKTDYDEIRRAFIETGQFTSKMGQLLQNRTKGAGKGAPKTRAFYLKTQFVKKIIPLVTLPTLLPKPLPNINAEL